MCIRDRQSLALLAPEKNKQQIIAPMRQIRDNIAVDKDTRALVRKQTTYTVSYTHLDVYKRQPQHHPIRHHRRRHPVQRHRDPHGSPVLQTVSYTHLFVTTEVEPMWDAADVMRMGKDLFIQHGLTTNRTAMDWFQRYYPEHLSLIHI